MSHFTKILLSASALALVATTASAGSAPELRIENFIGTIDVKTGDYDKITVTDADGASYDTSGSSVVIDDEQTIKNINCKQSNMSVKISAGGWNYKKRKGGYKNLDTYPSIKITAPADTHLVVDKAVIFGDVGSIGSADVSMVSCGDLEFEDINGAFDLGISGSGDVTAGNTGALNVAIAGSGDFTADNVVSAQISVAGSGDIEIANIDGLADINSAGSGDIDIGDVRGRFDYSSAGSGDLEIGDIQGATNIRTAGSGDVDVERIENDLKYIGGGSGDFEADYVGGAVLSVRVGGSGTVDIDGGNVDSLYVKVGGSGSVHYDGKSVDAELITHGSGSIAVQDPSGKLRKSKSGSGSIRVR